MRLINSYTDGIFATKVWFNHGNMEYVTQLFKGKTHLQAADYFTEDKSDAEGTAQAMLKQAVKVYVGREPLPKVR